jgi:1-deoxy-D-xylulose-5-phosphate reductoisomerase
MLAGAEALVEIATLPEVDTVLCAVTGTGALRAVVAALRAGKRVALASKEVMVMAGDIVTAIPTGEIVPVDSEHSGIFQCLAGRDKSEISRVTLTASGGPFLNWSKERIAGAVCSDALKHPVWSMGIKTTVDSATLMNKALELIEAQHLFKLRPEQLEVLIHPQATVHALVELCDGSVIAQLANPDMRIAIQYALSYPERPAQRQAGSVDLVKLGKLEFSAPDETRFPALAIGRKAMERGGAAGAVLNAADEAAVGRFVSGGIALPRIWELVEGALEHCINFDDGTLESRFAADAAARRYVMEQTT